jgi:hypothetical protein
MAFYGKDISKMPLDWTCPIRCRISHFMAQRDVWWTLTDEAAAQEARSAIANSLDSAGIPFLDKLNTDEGVLAFYASGGTMGFEIDRDELRLVLLASIGTHDEATHRLRAYEARWLQTGALDRASAFLQRFAREFNRQGV